MVEEIEETGREIIGNQDGSVNLTKEEFETLGKLFQKHSKKYSERQKRNFKMIGVHAEMTSYIDSIKSNGQILEIGYFITNISHK